MEAIEAEVYKLDRVNALSYDYAADWWPAVDCVGVES